MGLDDSLDPWLGLQKEKLVLLSEMQRLFPLEEKALVQGRLFKAEELARQLTSLTDRISNLDKKIEEPTYLLLLEEVFVSQEAAQEFNSLIQEVEKALRDLEQSRRRVEEKVRLLYGEAQAGLRTVAVGRELTAVYSKVARNNLEK